VPRARVVLLVTYRPEHQQAWSSKTYYTQVRIDPLPAENARTFLGALLGEDETLDPLKRLLIERTEGNPLFLEESVRTLVESQALEGEPGGYRAARAVEVVEVPATVETILAAPIDRLRPDDRRLLQSAAVIGRDVPFALLRAIADHDEDILREGLGRLRATEFLYETRIHPDLEYTFKHALTHDVAYGSLLEERRRALHADVVDAIERLYADRLAEHVERLAEHAWRGGLAERAVSYLRQAGLKASARSARDALARFEEALRILDAMPESAFTLEQGFGIRLELRQVLAQLGDFLTARERLREAEALAERLDDDRHRGRVGSVMTNIHNNLGELDEALASGTRALEVAERLGDSSLRVLTTTYLEQAHYYRGDYERAIELAIDNLAALPADRIADLLGPASVYDRIYLILSLAALGRFAEAAAHEAHVIRLAGLTQHAFTVGAAYCSAATLHLFRGHWVTARPLVEHAVAVCRNGSVVALLPYAVALSAWVLAQLGEASEALHRIQEGGQGLDGLAARGRILLGWEYHTLGRASLLLGQLDEARLLADRAVDLSRRQPGFAAHALRLLGDIATDHHRFDAERGEAHYRQALALAEPRGMRPVVAHCHLGLGKLYRRTGQREQAQEHLTSATAMYREMDMRFWLEQAETETKDWHENHSAPSPSSA
jgi:tetratricopeptide (TPR) repeat protein